jgi:hypothetical protein
LRCFCYNLDNLGIKKTLGPLENNNKCLIIYALPANKKRTSKTFTISSKSVFYAGLAIKKHPKNHSKTLKKPTSKRTFLKMNIFTRKV